MTDIEPYGPEWEAAMMKHTKREIVEMLGPALKEFKESRDFWKKSWSELNAAELKAEEQIKKLRKLLWLCHGCKALYGDDGEMQCSTCRIDFLRDPAELIEKKWREAAERFIAKGQFDAYLSRMGNQ